MDIIKKVQETIEKEIKLVKEEKILVALSGGKDSTVTAYILKKLGYKIEGFHIDLKIGKYSEECLKKVNELCDNLDIKLHIYDIRKEMGSGMCYLRSFVQSKNKGEIKNCAICGVIKKNIFNKQARKLKFDKIATGHHLDDETQTFFLNILKGSPELSGNSGPITKNLANKKFVPRIKPLFFVFEEDIKKFSKQKKLPVNYDKCPCAIDSYRIQVRKFMNTLSTKEKQNIMSNFQKLFPRIQGLKNTKLNYCESCGEPCRGKLCKMCILLKNEKP